MNAKPMTAVTAIGLAVGMMTQGTAHGVTFGSGNNQFVMEFAKIGNPGNPDDSGTTGLYSGPYGGVDRVFWMGTNEVSQDMIVKASVLGALELTMADMTAFGGNVGARPATGISWNEAARFVNWLNQVEGFALAYKFEFQPGEGGYSANADIELWDLTDSGYDMDNPFRNTEARYFLPSEDEWYKAAYYSGSDTTYYDYATASDTIPTAVAGGTASGTAVYDQDVFSGPADIDNAGGLSYYGAMGQNGNVYEWNESAFDGINDLSSEARGIRGGGWNVAETNLRSSARHLFSPTLELDNVGFRVASVPEPSAALLVLISGGALLLKRRRGL